MKKQDIYFIFTVIHDQYDEQTYQERVVEEKKIDTTPCVQYLQNNQNSIENNTKK